MSLHLPMPTAAPAAIRFPFGWGAAAAALAAALAATAMRGPPLMLLNTTRSLPRGVYVLARRSVAVGALVAVRAPPQAEAAGAAPRGRLLLKPVAAGPGQKVCVRDHGVAIDGRPVAVALSRDGLGRDLSAWTGCRILRAGEIFLMSTWSTRSFDSRYFGPAAISDVVAAYRPAVIF